jgi:hypothetical protein
MKYLLIIIALSVLSTNLVAQSLADDVLRLKTNGISDAVIIEYIKQRSITNTIVATTPQRPVQIVRRIDPESYEYFQTYYLHPRTMSYQYRLFAPYHVRYNPAVVIRIR